MHFAIFHAHVLQWIPKALANKAVIQPQDWDVKSIYFSIEHEDFADKIFSSETLTQFSQIESIVRCPDTASHSFKLAALQLMENYRARVVSHERFFFVGHKLDFKWLNFIPTLD